MIWLDAQLPPVLAKWISENFGLPCKAVRDLGLRDAQDHIIFNKAKIANAVVITKDRDFVDLLYRFHAPPRVIWLTCGNTSRDRLKEILSKHLSQAIQTLEAGAELVEIQ